MQGKCLITRVLTIAGSDSGGGAGIQADLKTFQAIGCYGMSAITALTAQNTMGVKSVYAVFPSFIIDQCDAVFEDIAVDAVKVGMLFSASIVEAVAACLQRYRARRIVVDPVMLAKGGSRLLEPDAVAALKEKLLPLASVVTPNIPEAEVLVGAPISSRADMEAAARMFLKQTPCVVLKGGHLPDPEGCADFFLNQKEGIWITYPRVSTRNTHGTGCTFSAAIAGYLAQGLSEKEAVFRARAYLQGAIEANSGVEIGKGSGPVDHGWNLGREK